MLKTRMGLKKDYKNVTRELAVVNREMAAQLILLASQTGDTKPLIKAVDALRKADELFSSNATPRENAQVRQALADTLLTLGRANNDTQALTQAINAYRDAITLASLLGDQKLRKALKRNYGLARNLLSQLSAEKPVASRAAFRGAA